MIPRNVYLNHAFYAAFLDEAMQMGMSKEAAFSLMGRLGLGSAGRMARAKTNKGHILTKKRTKRKRRLRQSALASRVDEKRLKQMLPDF